MIYLYYLRALISSVNSRVIFHSCSIWEWGTRNHFFETTMEEVGFWWRHLPLIDWYKIIIYWVIKADNYEESAFEHPVGRNSGQEATGDVDCVEGVGFRPHLQQETVRGYQLGQIRIFQQVQSHRSPWKPRYRPFQGRRRGQEHHFAWSKKGNSQH